MTINADYNLLFAFVQLAKAASFRKAAQELQVTPSALSHSLKRLEQQCAMRLVHRTTRSIGLTEAGAALYARLAPLYQDMQAALQELEHQAKQGGRVRINAPAIIAQQILAPALVDFRQQHPHIELEIGCDDALLDIIAAGFDAGIRFGESLQQDVKACRIGQPQQFVICASPEYLERYGEPQVPADLLAHNCLQLRFPSGRLYQWELQEQQQTVQVSTKGDFISDDFHLLSSAALAGFGLCYHYLSALQPHILAGRLRLVLNDYYPPPQPLYLYYSAQTQTPAALRAFIDFFKTES